MAEGIKASDVNIWFPATLQKRYVDHIVGKSGLTPRQATYFVRLWGYCYLMQGGARQVPIKLLSSRLKSFYCSHSEAADLFYCESQRGGHRSAGLMLDKFVTKKLLKRDCFDGSKTRLSLHIPEGFLLPGECVSSDLYADEFNPRSDAPLVASILEELYTYDSARPELVAHNIKQVLRQWGRKYRPGLRVLRQVRDDSPIGFAAFYPTSANSEKMFNLPPSESLHLAKMNAVDPIDVAKAGDEDCYAVFIRGWLLHSYFWNYEAACLLFQDSQETLRRMQGDFPNLCEVYTMAIHPKTAALAMTLGFKATRSDPNSSLRWIYMSLDKFLTVDYQDLLLNFNFNLK